MSIPTNANDGATSSLRAESVPSFRMSQLLLVLVDTHIQDRPLDLERLSAIEFLSANPFLVLDPDSPASGQLQLQGFSRHSVTYASPGQRFASRSERVSSDIAQLVAFGLVAISVYDQKRVFTATELGKRTAEKLHSVYADAYRLSVENIAPAVTKLSPKMLRESLERWLRVDPVLFDLIDSPTITEFEAESAKMIIHYYPKNGRSQ